MGACRPHFHVDENSQGEYPDERPYEALLGAEFYAELDAAFEEMRRGEGGVITEAVLQERLLPQQDQSA